MDGCNMALSEGAASLWFVFTDCVFLSISRRVYLESILLLTLCRQLLTELSPLICPCLCSVFTDSILVVNEVTLFWLSCGVMADFPETIELSPSWLMRRRSQHFVFVCSCFLSFINTLFIKYCRQEKVVKLKYTQSVLTTTHCESLWCGWSSWFCCFGFVSSRCVFWVWLVFQWSSVFFPLWPQRGAKWCVEACHPLISF